MQLVETQAQIMIWWKMVRMGMGPSTWSSPRPCSVFRGGGVHALRAHLEPTPATLTSPMCPPGFISTKIDTDSGRRHELYQQVTPQSKL